MTASHSDKSQVSARRRRRWWQHVVRAAVALAAALALAYALLPWWAPTGWLSRRIARELSARARCPVTIGRMDLSWEHGLSLHDIRFGDKPASGRGDMVVVKRLRCELSPLKMLFATGGSGDGLAWARLDKVRVNAAIDEAGKSNLSVLKGLQLAGPAPQRVSVREVTVTVQLPGDDKKLRLDVSDLQYRAGRLAGVGQVTMSAVLAQGDKQAPVTLVASVNRSDPVATCSFHFSRLELAELALPELLDLPLKDLSGLSSGQLDCRVDKDGVVEAFEFSLRVKGLDAKPRAGPALPVIQQAEVTLLGSYDWYPRKLRLDEFRLRLPGVDLKGKGRIHEGVLTGGWEGVESLEMTGRINPQRLAGLLLGDPSALPGRLNVDGDVEVRVSLRGDNVQLTSSVLLDATAAELRVGDRLAKPPGRTLSAELHGSLQRRTWQFAVDQTRLQIGRNLFRGAGAMQNIRRLTVKYLEADDPVTLSMVLNDMAGLDWRGSWEIVDVGSLRDLLGLDPLADVRLDGTLEGQWSVEHAERTLLRGTVRAGPDTKLSVGRRFVKPVGEPLRVEVSGDVSAREPRLTRGRLWVWLGDSTVSVDEGQLTFSAAGPPEAQEIHIQAQGRYWLRNAGGLLACMPELADRAGKIDGAARGSFQVALTPTLTRAHAHADATQLSLDFGDAFAKPAGQPAQVTLDFRADPTQKAARNRLTAWADLGAARASGVLAYGPRPDRGPVHLTGRVRLADAAWMLQWSPRLRRALKDYEVRGGMSADVSVRSEGDEVSGQITADADDLQFRLPGVGGEKPRGAALRVRLIGRADADRAVIDRMDLDVGKSSVNVSGTITRAPKGRRPNPDAYWPPPGVAAVDLAARGWASADPTLKELLPDLARRVRPAEPAGYVRFGLRLRGDDNGADLDGRFDATNLALKAEGIARKPAGVPATGRFSVRVPADLAHVRLKELVVNADAVTLRARGQGPLLEDTPLAGQAKLDLPDLSRLSAYRPELARWRPTGAATAEVDYVRQGGKDVIRSASVTARDAAATVRNKRCRVDGTVRLSGLRDPTGDARVDRITTDPLFLAVGGNHTYVVADVSRLPGRPTGAVTLLSERIDLAELMMWVTDRTDLVRTEELPEAERRELTRRAHQAVVLARKALSAGDVKLLMRAERLRHFDPIVRAFYEIQDLRVDARAREGKVDAGYRCGLNGGSMSYRFDLDLNEATPVVAVRGHLDRMLSSESLVLQLAQEFPGNTVYGTFSRTMDTRHRLSDVAMNLLDSRCLLLPLGTAVTVTEDGMVRGQGGPKFITRIFPGLNLATYRYRRMTGFAEFRPDGTTANDMIFKGKTYNLYIDGTTDSDRIGRYEIGVLLLVDPKRPEWLHTHRQGRIPILKFKALIKDGRFYNERVSLIRPDEAAYKIFLENNIIYRLWKAGRKRGGHRGASPPVVPPAGKRR